MASLREYARKRDFQKTPEPAAESSGKGAGQRFVIQKHDASRLHYDFRLELDGTLKSWAVPKGLPYAKGEKHLAVLVEDHPISYIDFEGTIPKGQYGGGTVMVWDRGTFEPLTDKPLEDLAGGKLHVRLNGEKARGEWHLVRTKGSNEWLLIKGEKDMKPVSARQDNLSVLSGRTMPQLAKGDRQWALKPAVGRTPRKKSAAPPLALPEFVEPMQAKLVDHAPAGDWLYEIKFDGYRALALRGGAETRLLSRNNKDLGAKFGEVMASVAALGVRDAILDGEIVALDEKGRSSFQLLQAYEIGEERPPLYFYVFDLLRLDGKDLRSLPVEERKRRLKDLLTGSPGILRDSASLGSDASALLTQARQLGLEGLIGKRAGSAYESGRRSGAWVKLKLVHEQEFVIGGYRDPEGTRKHFGALLVGVYDGDQLTFTGKVGTGFSDALLRSLFACFKKLARSDCPFTNLPEKRKPRYGQGVTAAEMKRCHWVDPQLVCQVKFSAWTRDHRLRQPVFLGLREDKAPAEVVREETP